MNNSGPLFGSEGSLSFGADSAGASQDSGSGDVFSQQTSDLAAKRDPNVLTVTQALTIAKKQLEAVRVLVEGEISEFSDKPGYKAVYFTLTDENSALPCLMWKSDFAKANLTLRQGMLVQISGSFSLYTAKGRMNFVARSIKQAGEGDLRMKVAQLARKLQAEGLMEPSRKKPLPKVVSKVAVVTSPRGKAVHDVLRTLRRRSPQVEVYVCGVPVEGEGAPSHIVQGLQVADASDCDVILLVRGGGSYEDLMPFNDEKVARAVVACHKPVVTGIGHEPDNSIADMVGDLRCSTPTAAAESVTEDVLQILSKLDAVNATMKNALLNLIRVDKQKVEQIISRQIFQDANYLLSSYSIKVDVDAEKLARAIPNAILANKQKLSVVSAKLESLSPLAVLGRGYSIAYDGDGHVVTSVGDVSSGNKVQIQVEDGRINCTVDDAKQNNLFNL